VLTAAAVEDGWTEAASGRGAEVEDSTAGMGSAAGVPAQAAKMRASEATGGAARETSIFESSHGIEYQSEGKHDNDGVTSIGECLR
jgi:hypothetical protein